MNRLNGFPNYVRQLIKGHLLSNGFSREDLNKPIIGIVNSWSEIVPGHYPLRELASKVKEGVYKAGGLPLEFNTIAICDGIAQGHKGMNYSLPSRELIADSIEAVVMGHDIFDGLVFLSSCDKIVPGMLMAMGRIDIPSIWIGAGPMHNLVKPRDSKSARRAFLEGKISEDDLLNVTQLYYPCPGVCPFLGTANTMCIVAEVLGVGLPGSALAPAGSAERYQLARLTGEIAVHLSRERLRPSQILTKEAFEDAIAVLMALGGSLNAVLHIPAIAYELGIEITLEDFEKIGEEVPLIARVVPNDDENTVIDLYHSGGVPAVMRELSPLLHLDRRTVSGKTYREVLEEYRGLGVRSSIIRPLSDPISKGGSIKILKGNLAPLGALLKVSALGRDTPERFEGTAKVFNSEDEFIDYASKSSIKEGEAIVIRYEGPRGGPGMRELHRCVEIINRYRNVALVTDGRLSGASYGISVAYVSPEAASGGPIAMVRDGDPVVIDVRNKRLDLLISQSEYEERMKNLSIQIEHTFVSKNSYLKYYMRFVQDSCKGAIRGESS
ncbi:MAG: dihydroxy-acid dehydratase [Synergistetes bacterium]|nr:dihydroxy-acid dehydratase [Synergistota bacterium]